MRRSDFIVRLSGGVAHSRAHVMLTPTHFSLTDLVMVVTRLMDAGCRGVYGELVDGSFAVFVVFPQGVDYGPSYVLDVAGRRDLYVSALKSSDVGAMRSMLRRYPLCVGVYDFGQVVASA